MSKVFTFEMQGLDKVLKKVDSYNTKLGDGIDKVLDDGAMNIANRAKGLAPRGKTGHLQASIHANVSVRHDKSVDATANYAAYVEFGTGPYVFDAKGFVFDERMRAYAREFFVSGKGRTHSQPFLFPAFAEERPKILAKIKAVLFD